MQLGMATAPASMRERELEVGRVVLRAVASRHPFMLRRAASDVTSLESGPARRALRRAVEGADASDVAGSVAGLLGWGSVLERHGEYAEAETAYRAAMPLDEADSCLALHAARAARKAGRRDAAMALYRHAGEQSAANPRMQLLVRIGEALVSPDAEGRLSRVLGEARREGMRDVVAIAREERALVRLSSRRRHAAIRDLLRAAAGFRDSQDRVRVLHRLADLLSAAGDLNAARETLHAALDIATEAQRAHTVQRLRTVARATGDEVAMRRTRGQGATAMVTLAPARVARGRSVARHVRRLRDTVLSASPAA